MPCRVQAWWKRLCLGAPACLPAAACVPCGGGLKQPAYRLPFVFPPSSFLLLLLVAPDNQHRPVAGAAQTERSEGTCHVTYHVTMCVCHHVHTLRLVAGGGHY